MQCNVLSVELSISAARLAQHLHICVFRQRAVYPNGDLGPPSRSLSVFVGWYQDSPVTCTMWGPDKRGHFCVMALPSVSAEPRPIMQTQGPSHGHLCPPRVSHRSHPPLFILLLQGLLATSRDSSNWRGWSRSEEGDGVKNDRKASPCHLILSPQ